MSEWQDISTAPKDGTVVFLTDGEWLAGTGWFQEDSGWVFLDPTVTGFLNGWSGENGPTDWMPLPKPPRPAP